MTAELDKELIENVISGFPDSGGWSLIRCAEIARHPSDTSHSPNWNLLLERIGPEAGLYAFLLPKSEFNEPFTFQLYGPRKNGEARRVPFKVDVKYLDSVLGDRFVAYVGRSANLRKRLQWHFHATKNSTAAQVREALCHARQCEIRDALRFMVEHACVAYYRLPGDLNVANRDIVEVALWAKYLSPFNIKSER